MKADSISRSYSLPGHPYCMLENDDDLLVMFSLISPGGINRTDVIVINYGRVERVVLGNETVVVVDFNVCISNGSGSKKQNGGIRIDWRFDIDKEVDLLSSFCAHQKSILLSFTWEYSSVEVGQKFVSGVQEFWDALKKYL